MNSGSLDSGSITCRHMKNLPSSYPLCSIVKSCLLYLLGTFQTYPTPLHPLSYLCGPYYHILSSWSPWRYSVPPLCVHCKKPNTSLSTSMDFHPPLLGPRWDTRPPDPTYLRSFPSYHAHTYSCALASPGSTIEPLFMLFPAPAKALPPTLCLNLLPILLNATPDLLSQGAFLTSLTRLLKSYIESQIHSMRIC